MPYAAMYLCIQFILILLSSFPCAQSAPPLGLGNSTDKRIACQQSTSLHSFLFFSATNDTTFHYGIKTAYTSYYPKALHNALISDNFRPLKLDSLNACGWQKARTVHKATPLPVLGSNRGQIYWKYTAVHWISPKDPKEPARWTFDLPSHKPPHVGDLPPNATLDRIAQILRENEPAADVYLLTTICLGYLTGFLGILLILNLVLRYMAVPEAEGMDDIELEIIISDPQKQPRTSASTDTIAATFCFEDGIRQNIANGISTPPPQYSRRAIFEDTLGPNATYRVQAS